MTAPDKNILVVDDDITARLMMRSALRKAGYEVVLAAGGLDALAEFRAGRFDMVMLDVDMPDLSGHAVCAALRAEAGEQLPIVMVTGMDDLASIDLAYESGATDFIAKPINWPLLGHRLRYLLRSRDTMIGLQAAEARNAAILNAIPDLLFELDIDGRYVDYHAPRSDLLAAPPEVFLGKTVADVLPAEAARICLAALHEAHEHGTSSGGQFTLPLEGRSRWFELSVARKADGGDRPRFIVLSRDITERKEAENRISRLAYVDSLTGLPNRLSFLERVDREIQRASRRHQQLAVLFMDLDGFKTINDTLGHAAGDLILQWAADRLRDGLRPSDLISRTGPEDDTPDLARLGGDEFTALLLDLEDADDALVVARRLGGMMRRPFTLDGRDLTLTASIGIALFPQDGGDAATLLKHADTAMYHAKNSGRDSARLYSASLTERAMLRLDLDAKLRMALAHDEFHLVYQPQIDTASGRVRGVEALIRWMHPVRGPVSPLEFIPLAEETGLIEQIGRWVLQTACADAAAWNRAGHEVRIAVNLSPFQFKNPGLLQSVVDILDRTGLAPDRLELEITEGSFLEDSGRTIETLHTLRSVGVSIALDDFGTGYSSLSYLTRLPIRNLKLDRSFVNTLLDSEESSAIVRAVLAMAKSLEMVVTAEGVENVEQARVLLALGCDCLQGFLFSKPVPAADLPQLLGCPWGHQLAAHSAIGCVPPPTASRTVDQLSGQEHP